VIVGTRIACLGCSLLLCPCQSTKEYKELTKEKNEQPQPLQVKTNNNSDGQAKEIIKR